MKTSWMILGLVAVVATAACGDDTSGTGGSGSGGDGSGGTGSGTGGDDASSAGGGTGETTSTGQGQGGGGTGGGGTGGGGTGGNEPVDGPIGEISIGLYNYLPDLPATLIDATFDPAARCERIAAEGSCELLRCGGGATLDAGSLALAGGELPASLDLVAGSYHEDIDGYLVESGDTVAVTGPGTAEVPAFELGATMPAAAAATAPDFTAESIPAASDLAVAWTGGEGEAQVTLDGAEDDQGLAERLRCSAPASAGQLSVPAGLLGQMTPGDVFFSLRTVARDEVSLDEWTFALETGRYASAADGISGDAFAVYALE